MRASALYAMFVLAACGGASANPPPNEPTRTPPAERGATEGNAPQAIAVKADDRPSYDKPSADDAWSRLLAFFKKNGV